MRRRFQRGGERHGRSAGQAAMAVFARLLAVLVLFAYAVPAWAACTGVVAGSDARLWRAATGEAAASLTFLGHSTFLIESPDGVRVVTDYNDYVRSPVTPDIVTMNNAHRTHFTEIVEPGVKHVLRGWDPEGGIANHQMQYRDVRVHNVATNVRGFGATRYNGNSIFVFEIADLCIAHLGHLHHTLTQTHLAELGPIDIVLVPVDGSFTLNQEQMLGVVEQIDARIAIPMHMFSEATLARFLARAADRFEVRYVAEPRLVVSRSDLPAQPAIVVLPRR
jgi:L-ascorbate metabolism protein UlaG (beta-lactamase superfamily)